MKMSISDGIEFFQAIEVGTPEELAEQACKSNISTSVFKDGKRNIASFEHADIIGLDIDNDKPGTKVVTINDAKRIFSLFKHIILTTRSHQQEKNGVVADRFRVILFLSVPIMNANDFYCTWYWLKNEFPFIDRQCKDPSRFWFKHGSVYNINNDGLLIIPIRYTEPEKPDLLARSVLPGERGELSKQTLHFLEFGVQTGSRNHTVYKVAREFQQALYDYEETESRIISSLERNGVITSDFSESEIKLTIRSAFSKDAKHAPRLNEIKARAFHYTSVGELLEMQDKQEDWLVDGLLIKGGLSVVVGIPKIGKTTLVRQLEKCVLKGSKFLERKTQVGPIIHYSFDEKARTAKKHYQKLGLHKSDKMLLHFGAVDSKDYLKDFEEDILRYKPVLAVVDTMFDMVNVENVNDYGPIKKQLSIFSSMAERTNCHIMFIHHSNKPNMNYGSGSGHSVLGSTAIFGSVDCCLIFEQLKDSPTRRTLSAKGRAVDDFDRVTLNYNKAHGLYSVSSDIEDIF